MKIFDTQVACHLLDENRLHKSLKALAKDILHVPATEIKEYNEVDTNNLLEFGDYAINDACWTYALYLRFAPQIEKENLGHLFYDIEMPFQFCLVELAINGMRADVSLAETMTYNTRHLYYSLEKEMLDMWGGDWILKYHKKTGEIDCEPSINFNSSAQVIPLIESLGFEITERTKKGHKSFGKKSKNQLKGKHKFIDLLIKYGQVEKLLSSFLQPFDSFVDKDGRVHSSFHNTVCVTGRLSSSNPNVEQLPRSNDIANIRDCYIADDDCVFVVADYKGQELRVLTEVSQDPGLKRAFVENLDLHQVTADDIGVSRDAGKTFNFGLLYGKGAYGFAKDLNISEDEAGEYIERYFSRFPRVRQAIEQCKQQVVQYGYVKDLAGRKRRFPEFGQMNKWQKEKCWRQAFNFLIQGYSASMIKIAAVKVIQSPLLKLVNIVHDEICVMCLEKDKDTVVNYVKNSMINAVKLSVPLEVEVHVGERYGQCK